MGAFRECLFRIKYSIILGGFIKNLLSYSWLLLLVSLSPGVLAQTLSGKVVDARYETGIDSIKVSANNGAQVTYTDENGNFTLTSVSIESAPHSQPIVFFHEASHSIEWKANEQPENISVINLKGVVVASALDVQPHSALIPNELPNGFYTVTIAFKATTHSILLFKMNGQFTQIDRKNSAVFNKNPLNRPRKIAPVAKLTFEKEGWVTKNKDIDISIGNTVRLTRTKIKVLIVDGFNNHNWQQTTIVVKAILNLTGLFDVSVITSPTKPGTDPAYNNWNPNFKDYEVIIMNQCNIFNEGSINWPTRIQQELEDFIAGGGGMFNMHAAVASFKNWDEYSKMVGLGWRDGNFGSAMEIVDGKVVEITAAAGTTHGARIDAAVTELNPHPITKGMPPVWLASDTEIYQYARGFSDFFPNINVLSYAKDGGKNWPFNLVMTYGKGYTFSTYMGHLWAGETYPSRMADVGFQTTFIRATEWLARKEIMYPVPQNFPTASSTSLDNTLDYLKTPVEYNSKVEAIFAKYQCADCHANGGLGWNATGGELGGFEFSNLDSAIATGVNIPTFGAPDIAPRLRIIPHDPENSYLYQKITSDSPKEGARMPLGSVMDAADIKVIYDWIKTGASN